MGRRSAQVFPPLTLGHLMEVLAAVSRPTITWLGKDGCLEGAGPVPTIGARSAHSWAVLAHDVAGLPPGLWLVEAGSELTIHRISPHALDLDPTWRAVDRALPAPGRPPAVVIPLLRELRLTSKYGHADSLIWREAGVFMMAAHTAAHHLSLASCILDTALTMRLPIAGSSDYLVDTGAVAVGGPSGRLDAAHDPGDSGVAGTVG